MASTAKNPGIFLILDILSNNRHGYRTLYHIKQLLAKRQYKFIIYLIFLEKARKEAEMNLLQGSVGHGKRYNQVRGIFSKPTLISAKKLTTPSAPKDFRDAPKKGHSERP